ncbi:MAG TPA: hypothetical protein DCE78_08585 [Bacteroidetes bacterium]|nr:hypothetical protein [Bacteroidota bacterium]
MSYVVKNSGETPKSSLTDTKTQPKNSSNTTKRKWIRPELATMEIFNGPNPDPSEFASFSGPTS